MADREKVIKGLHCCSHTDGVNCIYCPYDISDSDCTALMSMDVLALLKEHESKPDKCIICEGCGHKLQDDWNWCPWCKCETARGRRVKSDGF